jgi:uncharacterized membrane protein
MNISDFIKLYLIALPVFFGIDLIWLGLIARGFYRTHLGFLLRPQANWVAAILFYLVFIAGIILFAVLPAKQTSSLIKAIIYGVLFGFFTYATYDLTNLATVKDWPLIVTIVDICWGMFLCGSVSVLTYWISTII